MSAVAMDKINKDARDHAAEVLTATLYNPDDVTVFEMILVSDGTPTEKKQSIGAWDKTTKNCKAYISFTIDGKLYTMWKNEYKVKPTQPDYKIYEAEPLKPITNE